MKHIQIFIGIFIFLFGISSGLGWFVSIPILRNVSLTSVLSAKLLDCEKIASNELFDGSPQQRCYYKTVVSMVRSYGIVSAITALRSYMNTPKGKYLQGMRCHALAHEIGNAAARMGTPSDVLMNQCVGLCDFGQGREPIVGIDLGCMNGAGHTWVLMSKSVEEASAKCAIPSIPENIRQGCYHGIGHGLSERHGADIQSSIEECLRLPNEEARYQCSHAIFMEPVLIAAQDTNRLDIHAFCMQMKGDIYDSCIEFAGFMEFSRTLDLRRALNACGGTEPHLQGRCLSRLGQALYVSHIDIGDVRKCVESTTTTEASGCINGFIRASMDDVNATYGDRTILACNALPLSFRRECFRLTGELLFLRYGDTLRQSICKTIQMAEHRNVCMTSTVQ